VPLIAINPDVGRYAADRACITLPPEADVREAIDYPTGNAERWLGNGLDMLKDELSTGTGGADQRLWRRASIIPSLPHFAA